MDHYCVGCNLGKMTQKHFPISQSRASSPFELIHMDLVEMPVLSYHKYKYVLTILDDHTSYAFTRNLRHKSETTTAIKNFISYTLTQYNMTIKKICTDRGGEFLNKVLIEHLDSLGIVHETSAPHAHQQNG